MVSASSFSWTTIGATVGILYILWSLWSRQKVFSVRNKVVLITGASSGIGEACAHVFYKAGAKLILCARREKELDRVKAELTSWKLSQEVYEPLTLPLDLEDLSSISNIAQQAIGLHGRVDVLINNGGISNRGAAMDTLLEVEIKVMTINFLGTVALTKAVLPSMIQLGEGHIVAVSSVQGKMAIPYRACYGASKHAVQGYFDSLRAELHEKNVSVSIVSPSYVSTNLSVNAVTSSGAAFGKTDHHIASGMSPLYVAEQIYAAVVCKKRDVVLGPVHHKLAIFGRTLAPYLFSLIMQKRAITEKSHEN